MRCSELWSTTTVTKNLVNDDIDKYGHLLKWQADEETVLEVGSADGSITRDILYKRYGDRMKKLVAIDKLDGMTEYARSLNKNKAIDFVTMDIMDQENIKKIKGCFDHVFTFYSIHWIPDNRSLVKNFYEMLKSHGQVFITIMVNTPFHESFRRLSKHGAWSKYVPVEEMFCDYTDDSVKYFTTIMEEAGFQVDLCKRNQNFDIIENIPDFVRALSAMYKYTSYIPQELQDEFLQYHIKYCYENSIHVGGLNKYKISYDAL
ncbi:putative juvenile hormone acid methyltransferase, partial [Trypoxylus dichotomus]